ncbi:MAG: phosphatidate cytidylyltransferase [Alphaproteobacteria bacterium]|nr:phosphatidate cytidylyltransferase [Alphaproteobacteria bacterium]
MKNIVKRILVGAGIAIVAIFAAALEYYSIPAVRWLAVLIVFGMAIELAVGVRRRIAKEKDAQKINQLWTNYSIIIVPAVIFIAFSAHAVGSKPWIMFLLLLIISAADTGAWFFGKWLGTTKLWEKISPNKTWSGQIAGIICGCGAAVLYGIIGAGIFMPQLMWIGIAVALLSQYGDLTASWLKRKLGVKDFGGALPGHGGILDRFDGWIFVLPITWLAMA